jgi:hypothetical protein
MSMAADCLPPLVAAGVLARFHGGQKTARQGKMGRRGKGLCGGLDHLRAGQHVPGDGKRVPDEVSAPVDAAVARVGSETPRRIHHMDLALAPAVVGIGEDAHHVRGGCPGPHQLEAAIAVVRVHEGLRGDGADAGGDERDAGADRKRAGGDGDADMPGLLIPGDDGPGHVYLPTA